MSHELEQGAHPDPEAIHAPPVSRAPRIRYWLSTIVFVVLYIPIMPLRGLRLRRRRWLSIMSFVLVCIPVMPFLGLLSPVLSPVIYANLAPPQWHNATPHGSMVLTGYAVSTDEPGLAFACGWLSTVAWPQPWSLGSMRYWRSTDGGAQWQLFQPPFQTHQLPFADSNQFCTLAMPPGGHGTVLAEVSSGANSAPTTLWVSHDAGVSWHKVLILVNGDTSGSLAVGIQSVVYRDGLLYGSVDFGLFSNTAPLGFSADDGGTWTTVKMAPDRLVQEGWQVDSLVPDYRAQGWWYRELSRTGSIPMLEHSQDNGSTWVVVGSIGTSALGALTLVTTPVAPGRLCAGHVSGETRNVHLFASGDNGRTWRTGTMPTALQHAQGETTFTLAIGDTGECYEGFHYGLGQDPEEGNSHFGFFYLASDSAVLGDIPLTNDGNDLGLSFTLVPAGNGMPARLVTELDGKYPGWAPLFAGLAAETTTDGQIVWHAVPWPRATAGEALLTVPALPPLRRN